MTTGRSDWYREDCRRDREARRQSDRDGDKARYEKRALQYVEIMGWAPEDFIPRVALWTEKRRHIHSVACTKELDDGKVDQVEIRIPNFDWAPGPVEHFPDPFS